MARSAENAKRLSGAQIRTKFAGMQLTDEVHWRDVYDRDGTLRSYSMGTKKVGKWAVERDKLCLYLSLPGWELPLDGVLQTPADRN